MAENSNIAWTDHTFNPWIGCTHVSEGCRNCYAEILMDHRYGRVEWGAGKPRLRTSEQNWKKPERWNRQAEASGVRTKVFCASLADVFDPEVPEEWRQDLYALIRRTPWLDWQILTKRPELFPPLNEWPPNVWLGVTIEDNRVIHRLEPLMKTEATIRWLSIEPQIGLVTIPHWILKNIDWVIVGGESGAGCREFDPGWGRSLLRQCRRSGTAFFMKQMGGHPDKRDQMEHFPENLRIREFPEVA